MGNKIQTLKETSLVTHHVIREGQGGSGRVRVFSKTNQGHGLGKVKFQETEQLNSQHIETYF